MCSDDRSRDRPRLCPTPLQLALVEQSADALLRSLGEERTQPAAHAVQQASGAIKRFGDIVAQLQPVFSAHALTLPPSAAALAALWRAQAPRAEHPSSLK